MASRSEDPFERRKLKLSRLRARGVDPYPPRSSFTNSPRLPIASLIEEFCSYETKQKLGQGVVMRGSGGFAVKFRVSGRVMGVRDLGGVAFVDIRDGSGAIQLYLQRNYPRRRESGTDSSERLRFRKPLQILRQQIDIGDFVDVVGLVFRTRRGEISLKVRNMRLLSKTLRPLPEKWHGLRDVETRLRQRYLDLIANDSVRTSFQIRSRIVAAVRHFLDRRGFIEVETPVLVPVAAGAAARPFATHHNALDRDLYLRIATELYLKRLVVGGFDKVYEIGRVFRNEGIDQDHNPEFTLLESYEAYADYTDVMDMVETLVSDVAKEVLGTTVVQAGTHEIDLAPPWPRLPLVETLLEYSGIDIREYQDYRSLQKQIHVLGIATDIEGNRGRLIDKLLDATVVPNLIQPSFLVDYPVEMSPLAKRKPGDTTLVERFEAFVGGVELANAFSELNDPVEQRRRMEAQEQMRRSTGDEEMDRLDEDFLIALEHGMPPTGGLGIGIDRLVMLLSSQQSIREAVLFPQMRTTF